MYIKNAIQQIALKHGLTATLMPKPMYGEAGNGMHFHMLLKKRGAIFFMKKAAMPICRRLLSISLVEFFITASPWWL